MAWQTSNDADADDGRRTQTVRLTVEQKRWLANEKVTRRMSENAIIVAALVAAGAPPTPGPSEDRHGDEHAS